MSQLPIPDDMVGAEQLLADPQGRPIRIDDVELGCAH